AVRADTHEHWIMGAAEMIWPDDGSDAHKRANEIAGCGKRVLVLLLTSAAPTPERLPDDMHPVALIILAEKIRADAKETLDYFARQGVALKVISGDSPRTVGAIARAVDLDVGEPVDARTLPQDIHELAGILEKQSVFGRVSPDQKRAMVRALQSNGHVVAMTGDGVNDSLALKDADIGIAMGSGVQATKAVAELVLLDDKFSSMPHVLAEGRRVIANIERVANLFVIKNAYSLFLALAVTVAGLPYPLLPRHLSVLSALTIGIPAFFLSLAASNQRYVPGFLRRVLSFAVPTGVVIAVLIFTSYLAVKSTGSSSQVASTVVLSVVMLVGIWVLFCLARPLRYWKAALIIGPGVVFVGLITVPFTREFLSLSVQLPQMLWALGFGAAGIVFVELLWRRDQRVRAKYPRAVAGE
ncbi:MAG: HAD-IC family P-type ATPase, partial [Acidobacteriota bacterium]